jgi:hypothetical protein
MGCGVIVAPITTLARHLPASGAGASETWSQECVGDAYGQTVLPVICVVIRSCFQAWGLSTLQIDEH